MDGKNKKKNGIGRRDFLRTVGAGLVVGAAPAVIIPGRALAREKSLKIL